MEFTKDSIVTSICGIDSNITIEKLYNSMTTDGIKFYEDLETTLEQLNDGFDDFDEFLFDGKTFSLNIQYDCGVTEFLENCFGEKYLMMVCTQFWYNNFNKDGKGGIWQFPGESINLVESIIESDGDQIFSEITKEHSEYDINEINESNFLSESERKDIDKYENDQEKYERGYKARYTWYFMKKSEFNLNKWWSGWTHSE